MIALFLSFKLGLYETLIKDPLNADLHVALDTEKLGNRSPDSNSDWVREVTEQRVNITGSTTTPSEVRLTLNGSTVGKTYTDHADAFSFSNVALREGRNRVEVIAERHVLWRQISANSSLYLNYSPPTQSAPSLISKSTYVEIGNREFKVNLEATMSRDNPIAQDIVTGKITAQQFIEQVFGYVFINDYFIINDLTETIPTFTSSETAITISLSSKSPTQVSRILSPFGGQLNIRELGTSNRSPVAGTDTFTLKVLKDYDIKSVNPVPFELKEGQAKWVSAGNEILPGGIQVQLSANPWISPLRLFQITPSEILPDVATRIARVLADMLVATPILWLLWLSINYKTAMGLDNRTARQLSITTKSLLVLCLVPIAINLTFQLTAYLSSYFNELVRLIPEVQFPVEAIFPAITAIQLALLSAALFISLYWFRKRPWVQILLAFFGSMGRAEVLVASVFVFAFLVDGLGVRNYRFFIGAVFTLFCFTLIKRAIKWLKAALDASPDPSAVKLGKFKTAMLLIAIAFTTYPLRNVLFEIYEAPIFSIVTSYSIFFFGLIKNLTPYLLFPAIMFLLRRSEPTGTDNKIVTESGSSNLVFYQLGTLVFASYLVGTSPNWFWVPVPFLLALWIFPKMILHTSTRRKIIHFALPMVLVERGKLIRAIDSWANLKQLHAALDSLEKKFGSGDLAFNDYERRKLEIEDYMRKHDEVLPLQNSLRIKDTVLAVGPCNSDWDNGWWAAKRSLVLILPLFLVYSLVFTIREFQPQNLYPFLWFCIQVITFVGDGLIAAFFFGYFFNSFRGSSGLKKGITVSVSIILCLLPAWIVPLSSSSLTNLLGLFFRAGQTFLFFTILGIWAFDYRNYREALGGQFQWRKFAKFGDLPSATAFLSVILTALGVAITTVVTGQFTSIVSQLVKVAIPSIPFPPPK